MAGKTSDQAMERTETRDGRGASGSGFFEHCFPRFLRQFRDLEPLATGVDDGCGFDRDVERLLDFVNRPDGVVLLVPRRDECVEDAFEDRSLAQ